MAKILVLNGPNLNLLGTREPSLYGQYGSRGHQRALLSEATRMGHELVARQSNAEHEMIEWLHAAGREGFRLHAAESCRLYPHQRRVA